MDKCIPDVDIWSKSNEATTKGANYDWNVTDKIESFQASSKDTDNNGNVDENSNFFTYIFESVQERNYWSKWWKTQNYGHFWIWPSKILLTKVMKNAKLRTFLNLVKEATTG